MPYKAIFPTKFQQAPGHWAGILHRSEVRVSLLVPVSILGGAKPFTAASTGIRFCVGLLVHTGKWVSKCVGARKRREASL